LQVTRRDRRGKSPTGFDGTTNRRGLLYGVMAKVQQRNCPKSLMSVLISSP
jgi:hypothetical protein